MDKADPSSSRIDALGEYSPEVESSQPMEGGASISGRNALGLADLYARKAIFLFLGLDMEHQTT